VSGRAGIELTPSAVRLVRLAPLTGRISQTVEMPWDPTRPLDAVTSLKSKVGPLQGISLTIGLGFLEVVRLDLPPVSASERARIVELEPDRYFAAANRERLVVTVAPDEPIAFGASALQAQSWLAAFETWAPVEWVEPAPISLARVLGHDANATGGSGWRRGRPPSDQSWSTRVRPSHARQGRCGRRTCHAGSRCPSLAIRSRPGRRRMAVAEDGRVTASA
jgi:hypothetical protein